MFKKFTWGHGIIVALGAFIIFILSMIFIFTKGWQNAEMVSDNYYQEELAYQDVINAKNNADALPQKPTYERTGQGIKITFPEALMVDNKKVNFHLFRTDDAKLDVTKDLSVTSDNSITIPNQILYKGSYTLKILWQSNAKPYQVDYDVLWN